MAPDCATKAMGPRAGSRCPKLALSPIPGTRSPRQLGPMTRRRWGLAASSSDCFKALPPASPPSPKPVPCSAVSP
jgi:hypothetical protein